MLRAALFHYGRWIGNGDRALREVAATPDAAPEDANRLQAVLLALDRGDFIRSRAAQRVLLERHFRITREGRFPNTPHTLVQALFVCEPRP